MFVIKNYANFDLTLKKIALTLIYAAVGLNDTHCFEWCFLQKFLSRKIVKQFVFLVQSIVFLAVFLNLEKYIAFISF